MPIEIAFQKRFVSSTIMVVVTATDLFLIFFYRLQSSNDSVCQRFPKDVVIGFGKFSVWLKNPSRISSQWAHTITSEWRREKKFIRYRVYVLSLCLRLCLQQSGKGLHLISCRRLGTLSMSVCNVSLSVYCTWFRHCYTSLLPVPVCVLHVILSLLYVPVACPCVCTARDFVANTHCFDMSLQHEPSFFLVSTKPLWHHLSFFWSILVRAEARFITHDVGECKEVTQQVVPELYQMSLSYLFHP